MGSGPTLGDVALDDREAGPTAEFANRLNVSLPSEGVACKGAPQHVEPRTVFGAIEVCLLEGRPDGGAEGRRVVREFTPSGASAVEISPPGHGRGDPSPRKVLSIQWLERLAHAGDFGMGFALLAQHEQADFEPRSGGSSN